MKVRSQRFGRWVALAALALAVAAIVAPAAGAMPLGSLPCTPHCGSFEPEQTAGAPLAGGPTVAQLTERRNAVVVIATPPLSELEKFSFGQPSNGVRPDDQPGLRGPGAADPVIEPLYPVVAPLSGPESVPTPTRVPVTFDSPIGETGGTDWPAVGIAAGLGALLLIGGAVVVVMNRRRPPLAHA